MQNSLENNNKLREEDGGHRKSAGTKFLSKTTICTGCKVRTNPFLKTEKEQVSCLCSISMTADFRLINCGLQKPLLSADEAELIVLEATDREANSHVILTDKYIMTDLEDRTQKVVLNKLQSYKALRWSDPRLLKKYSTVRRPYRKSLTIPCVDKSASEENSDDETELLYSKSTHFLIRCLYYFCAASVSFIGLMCGVTLVTLVLSKVLDENVFDFFAGNPIWGSIRQMMNAAGSGISRLLTMLTSEAQEEEPQSWFYKL